MKHIFTTSHKNSTKLHTTFSQRVFNHCVNFRSKWTTNVEMTVGLKLSVQKPQYCRYQQYWMRRACALYGMLLK